MIFEPFDLDLDVDPNAQYDRLVIAVAYSIGAYPSYVYDKLEFLSYWTGYTYDMMLQDITAHIEYIKDRPKVKAFKLAFQYFWNVTE